MVPEYVARRVKHYAISEVEMDGLTMVNTQIAVCLSLATLFFGLAIPIVVSVVLVPQQGLAATTLWLLIVLLLVLALAAGIAIWPLSRQRGATVGRVKRDSTQITKP
jgi:hypothetical protein